METKFDILGIGNAIVDVVASIPDSFIEQQDMTKGKMQLVNAETAQYLYQSIVPTAETSGGSISNSCVGLASFGGRSAFIGKVSNDALGDIYTQSLRQAGVHFTTVPISREVETTAMCLSLVTPDAERTMNTYLGASRRLSVNDIDSALIKMSKIVFLEGYSFDSPESAKAFYFVAELAEQHGTKIALSLSDKFCVAKHRTHFQAMLGMTHILFANEGEIKTLFETDSFEQARELIQNKVDIACLTRGSKGSEIVTPDRIIKIPVRPVTRVVDTTGAGDLYAAGFLFGYTNGMRLEEAGNLGAIAASEAISHYGARPQTPLANLIDIRIDLGIEKPAPVSDELTFTRG